MTNNLWIDVYVKLTVLGVTKSLGLTAWIDVYVKLTVLGITKSPCNSTV